MGWMQQFNVSGLTGGIFDIQLTLDIRGGFNGDLYAYLAAPQGQMAVLLNRPGLTGGNPFGYSDGGFNVVFAEAWPNIHGYGGGYSTNLAGQVIGTWSPDGRNIDPQSLGSVFDGAGTAADFTPLYNSDANGMWTLFIADLGAGGGLAIVDNAMLTIVTAPEPQTWLVLAGGLVTLMCARRKSVVQKR